VNADEIRCAVMSRHQSAAQYHIIKYVSIMWQSLIIWVRQ